VTKTFTYGDAVRLLGGSGIKKVDWLDRVVGGRKGVAAADVLNCFGVSGELVRFGRDLVGGFAARRQGLSRFDRTQRIQAAHAIIVITAYFEAVATSDLPFPLNELELTRSEQVTLVADRTPRSGRLGALVGELLDTSIPLPTPQRPRDDTVRALRMLYEGLSARLVQFVQGLAAWDGLAGPDQGRFTRAVRGIPSAACTRYESLLDDLAVTFPEVAHWANIQDQKATQHQLRELRVALAGLGQFLRGTTNGTGSDERLAGLTRAHRAMLDRPIFEPSDMPEGLRIPVLGDAYLDPRFRAADVSPGATPSEDSWWYGVPVRDDMNTFLAGYLTSPQATQAPLLVLGQPGSGKSVLTRVLAARLPVSDFLVVRVILREVPADMDLQDQVEQAIRYTTGERREWPALVRSAGNALPLVLLDGFDEMLQATGVSQTDYLMKIREFQRREAAQDRPVAVVVTSRITVADRARIPDDTVAVRLEPFSPSQVTAWLDMWRAANERYFGDRGLTALPAQTALIYPELSEQPLLLLMLALYDADNNVLQHDTGKFSRADLYERLLIRFARREIDKAGDRYRAAGVDQAVEEELRRLSVAAFAMFNRVSQWVTEADLDRDLTILLGSRWRTSEAQGFRVPLGAAELVLGQFFFIQESQAYRGDNRLHTYEFLHATFGEYLVARLISQVLAGMVAREMAAALTPLGANPQDDGMLYALLSFATLSSRPSVIEFLIEMSAKSSPDARRSMTDLLIRLCALAGKGRGDRSHLDYEPRPLSVTARHANYSANLVTLVVIVNGEIRLTELFGVPDPIPLWYEQALLWRSQNSTREFTSLVDSLELHQARAGAHRDAVLRLDDGSFVAPPADLDWTYSDLFKRNDDEIVVFVLANMHPDLLGRRSHFLIAKGEVLIQHLQEPLIAVLKDTVNSFVRWPNDMVRSTAHLLLQAVFMRLGDMDDEAVATVYLRCAQVAMLDRLPWSTAVRDRYSVLLLERIRTDERVEPAVVDEVLTLLLPRKGIRTQLIRCVLSVLGRDVACDRALAVKLQTLVDADCAVQEPVVVLEAWLRLVELGLSVEGVLSSPAALFPLLDPAVVRAARRELITRTRWAVADMGATDLPRAWRDVLS
jgi:NACHT conflict system protein